MALYGPVVFLWCRQSGLTIHDAADVVQEVLTAVATHVAEFRRQRPEDSFRGWLWTITRNKVRDQARRRHGQPQAQGGTTAQQQLAEIPDSVLDFPERSDSLSRVSAQRALELIRAEFEDRTWRAFWRAAVDGLAAADVAAELGMTSHAVRQAKYRVLQRLRSELEGLLD